MSQWEGSKCHSSQYMAFQSGELDAMRLKEHERVRRLFLKAIASPNAEEFLQQIPGGSERDAVVAEVRRLLQNHNPEERLLEMESSIRRPAFKTKADATRTQQFDDKVSPIPSSTVQPSLPDAGTIPETRRHRVSAIVAMGLALVIIVMTAGVWLDRAVNVEIVNSLEQTMRTLLDQQVTAIRTWLTAEQRLAASWCANPAVVAAVENLNELTTQYFDPRDQLRDSGVQQRLHSAVRAGVGSDFEHQFAVWNREGTLLADSCPLHQEFLGNGLTEYGAGLLTRVFRGETVLWLPTEGEFITERFELRGNVKQPGIAIIAPVIDDSGRPFAAMLISSDSLQRRLEELMRPARVGEFADAFAFANDGILLTESRFAKQLQTVGRIFNTDAKGLADTPRIADPGGNLLDGYLPSTDSHDWPCTRSVSSALLGNSGTDFSGYRDCRGIPVLGVWQWIPDYRFGLAVEIEREVAFRPLLLVRRAFLIIVVSILGLSTGVALILFTRMMLRRRLDTIQVGAYQLTKLLGEGGFSRVYLAWHKMLNRQTAIKILKRNHMNTQNRIRFAREVQLASTLSHPNTIRIFDCGQVSDGRFYYAMEFVDGICLREVIQADGPQPPERVVRILTQICQALCEVHSLGLIHRDIKPQNVMLCQRGGEHDVVKVLDFGLAKYLVPPDDNKVTQTQLLVGTPLYIAPERILNPACTDPRSDIYSIGILGYFLLVGCEPFVALGSVEALTQTMYQSARRPSERCPRPIPASLDDLILKCHARNAEDRPSTIDEVLTQLRHIPCPDPWTADRADLWWATYRDGAADSADGEDIAPAKPQRTSKSVPNSLNSR